jgi:hypothetical protein
MALRVLTNQEKEELRNNSDFREECKWALLNKAAYWKGLDGASVPGNNHVRWAKSRQFSASVAQNPQIADPNNNYQIADRFLMYIKNEACVDDQVAFDPSAAIATLLAGSKFESAADLYFDDQIATVLF